MTHRAAVNGGTVPRIWLLPIVIVTALLAVTAAGIVSRSIVLDMIAWWPVWLGLTLITIPARGRRLGRLRISGLVPLAVAGALIVFVIGHIAGWQTMPSATVSLVGPVADPSLEASMSARIGGELEVAAGGEYLYQVDPLRRGGPVGIPVATEETQGLAIRVTLDEPSDPGLYAFAGWFLTLNPASLWDLTLEGDIDADLTGLEVTGLQLFGEGTVSLANTEYSAPVAVLGTFELMIPDTVPARVIGEAVVPDTWEKLDDGWRSPAPGDGWVISPAEGTSLSIVSG